MSLTRTVPLGLPSVFQSSLPSAVVAVKYQWGPTCKKSRTRRLLRPIRLGEGELPRSKLVALMSWTNVGVCDVAERCRPVAASSNKRMGLIEFFFDCRLSIGWSRKWIRTESGSARGAGPQGGWIVGQGCGWLAIVASALASGGDACRATRIPAPTLRSRVIFARMLGESRIRLRFPNSLARSACRGAKVRI